MYIYYIFQGTNEYLISCCITEYCSIELAEGRIEYLIFEVLGYSCLIK